MNTCKQKHNKSMASYGSPKLRKLPNWNTLSNNNMFWMHACAFATSLTVIWRLIAHGFTYMQWWGFCTPVHSLIVGDETETNNKNKARQSINKYLIKTNKQNHNYVTIVHIWGTGNKNWVRYYSMYHVHQHTKIYNLKVLQLITVTSDDGSFLWI